MIKLPNDSEFRQFIDKAHLYFLKNSDKPRLMSGMLETQVYKFFIGTPGFITALTIFKQLRYSKQEFNADSEQKRANYDTHLTLVLLWILAKPLSFYIFRISSKDPIKVVTKNEKKKIIKTIDILYADLLEPRLLNMPTTSYMELTRLLSLCQKKLVQPECANYPERKSRISSSARENLLLELIYYYGVAHNTDKISKVKEIISILARIIINEKTMTNDMMDKCLRKGIKKLQSLMHQERATILQNKQYDSHYRITNTANFPNQCTIGNHKKLILSF